MPLSHRRVHLPAKIEKHWIAGVRCDRAFEHFKRSRQLLLSLLLKESPPVVSLQGRVVGVFLEPAIEGGHRVIDVVAFKFSHAGEEMTFDVELGNSDVPGLSFFPATCIENPKLLVFERVVGQP